MEDEAVEAGCCGLVEELLRLSVRSSMEVSLWAEPEAEAAAAAAFKNWFTVSLLLIMGI